MTQCEVCKNEESVGVACVPGVPFSAAYGQKCLEANAHPYGIVVGNTACLGGLERAADWWKQIVKDTCTHLGKSEADFAADVTEAIADMTAYDDSDSIPPKGVDHE